MAATEPRERQILAAARRVFDERGLQDAPMGEIAREVGVNRVILYRHFSSKDELFALTVANYLDELGERMEAVDHALPPVERLSAIADCFATFCLEYPAYLDCCLSLMRRPADVLRERMSAENFLELGRGMARCIGQLSRALAAARDTGAIDVPDVDFAANRMYVQALGMMHLARIGIGIREPQPGTVEAFPISAEQVRASCARDLLALAGLGQVRPDASFPERDSAPRPAPPAVDDPGRRGDTVR